MPYTLKVQQISVKDPDTGEYSGVDVFAERGGSGGGTAGDITYDPSASYSSGTVGNELSTLSTEISAKQTAPSQAGTAGQVLGLDNSLHPVWVNQSGGGGGAVDSVNGKTGVVVLDASDVGALPDDTAIPTKTSDLVNDSGYITSAPVTSVNNKTGAVTLTASDVGAGSYSKPSGGIPKTDLASAVQTSLEKADTALQTAPVTSVNNKTGSVSLSASDVGAATTDLGITGATAGTYAKVKTVDANGKPTSWETGSGGGGGGGAVDDVQINDMSIVSSGVANIPIADSSNLGVVKAPTSASGISFGSTGVINISAATSVEIKAQASGYKPITPNRQHEAVFYGLAAAAGDTTQAESSSAVGTYTEDAKASIRAMLGISIYNGGVS